LNSAFLAAATQEEDSHFTNAELIERRRMESEIQADEDEERRRKREVGLEDGLFVQGCP
jgi:hypothetical protein